MKVCSKCKEEKDYKYFHKNKYNKDGFAHSCKLCRSKELAEYNRKNKVKAREKNQRYYKSNKEKLKQQAKSYYHDNKEKVLEKVHIYYWNNQEKIIEYKKEYRLLNADQLKEYRQSIKDRIAARTAKRRARKLQRTPKWLTQKDFVLIESFYEEARRLTTETGIMHHVDHIVPLKGDMVSGLHCPDNLQVLTYLDNIRKSNKLIKDYL